MDVVWEVLKVIGIAVVVGVILLYLEYRTHFFAQWMERQGKDDVEKFIDQDRAKDILEVRKVAAQWAGVLLTRRVWEHKEAAYKEHFPTLERLRDNPQLSDELVAAIRHFLAAVGECMTNDEPGERVPLPERRQSHEKLAASRDALLALTEKELAALTKG